MRSSIDPIERKPRQRARVRLAPVGAALGASLVARLGAAASATRVK